ncbi:pre-rRNA-processing protein-like protein TSR2 [Pleomassaria siparia CBS 279.74]|uniref:Pre-rRNA-processing protein-like protein TSR2 n=1 Tax=Pleomassaria siparia CBS 279.74 TaxID=1314801 RepID=A0A6G1KMF2_9PLEO|nr:pre-rRNA-processing protein-like protein TSR2 [Pleomassaria siparia CBS 279.74]
MSAPSQPSGATQSEAKFDLGIWHTLFNWDTLSVAVQNHWGGPDSSDKRDWLAGAISEAFANEPLTDAEDIEILLLEVLQDEFGVRLEDETEVAIAKDIMAIRKEVLEGNFATVDRLQAKWEASKGKEVKAGKVQVREQNQDAEWDSVDEEEDDEEEEDRDVDMEDAPQLVAAKPKVAPVVDEDGFTKVVGKRRT